MSKEKFTLGSSIRNDIGNHLLSAMKNLDSASAIIMKESDNVQRIHDNELEDIFYSEAEKMIELKREIKKILNRHFDDCAIQKFLNNGNI